MEMLDENLELLFKTVFYLKFWSESFWEDGRRKKMERLVEDLFF